MAVDGIQRVGSISPLRSTLRIGPDRGDSSENPEIAEERKKFLDEQKKAAEDHEREQRRRREEKEREQELEMLENELEASKKEAEAMEDSFESFSKCMKIATRVAKGDIVPAKDLKYLAEHEPDLYKQAILMRVPNPKPKKHKSLIDDEDESSDEIRSDDSPESSDDMSVEESAETGDAGAETPE